MCNETERMKPRVRIMTDADIIEEVNNYKYIGRVMSPGNEMHDYNDR